MANGSDFAGPAVAAFENDQFQGHNHNIAVKNSSNTPGTANSVVRSDSAPSGFAGGLMDGVLGAADDGTPRDGDETRPFNAGVNYCIKF